MCIFTYTLLKNTEYTFKLGCTVEPTSSIGRGGAGAYFYEGGRLLVCCGGGGASGWESNSHGGAGGGAGVAGQPGNGRGGGEGGRKVNTGELQAGGAFNIGEGFSGPGTPGGKVESCTTGMYWRNQGIGPCEFMGEGRFRNINGVEISNTSNLVKRGYKADTDNYGYRHNGGNSISQWNGTFVGGGGSGAYGGNSCSDAFSGGGGGSGYTNGSVNMLWAQVGGNENSQAQALIELLTSDNEKWVNVVRGV